ncbi:Glutathione-regulated potassium-efflux system ancillary protein KefF [Paraburkholderia aspalathi]|uniref:Glutathione-regulated potassium-efflux system ancillary protein KefF n=1 Tax=Paraburkholderia aspalathi TaxID=1324617 RepID=A0ABN7N849_9BURK|nr:NAD(P)H-dependent oxidoreductase [Paraburkholderia aspalathi]MBK3823915.1 NAD(P)H-dependent oxidoreductase [Paraburkholderia aspalathi]MBK3835757.1 NAD(P)H-dependent oxidoreductase [Paraburkholderia aspalathi]MBK3843366.1 NAD(P)H-dependent oxidoreductase [Paraburkholderia aspalathi]MBK3865536.1 NAD(P)H-dependent oxidoreductase [Paraburkholderia aspalathi]CAE6851690.1 Glutathione-regulated potassium-efflux system ancillary protein KefF [Paraburkholderia aspalathi]
MKVLIVHAHPEPQSFTASMQRHAVETLQAQGHEVIVSDLYAMNWNPVVSAADFGTRKNSDYLVYALEQRENVAAGTIAPDIRAELDKLLECDLVIFSFPLFWCSVPAIIKGWIDRVLVSGKVYGGQRFYDRGGMRGKRAMLAYTCGGRDFMFDAEGVHGEMDLMLRHVLRGTLGYAGFEVLPSFVAYHVPYIKPAEREAMLGRYGDYLTKLDQLEPLSFPSLDDFDAEMHPRVRTPQMTEQD